MKTFATSSGNNGGFYGKYSVKLYNSNNVLIYQVDNGGNNSGKLPSGGVLSLSIVASSMSEAVANPTTYYYAYTVINQSGQSSDLYNYYWTSYSRGTDGAGGVDPNNPLWHNDYLDSYIPLRHKSIYDPCPYGYRIPSNGTYNEFTTNPGWLAYSYIGGASWDLNSGLTWLVTTGDRNLAYTNSGYYTFRRYAIASSNSLSFAFGFYPNGSIYKQYILSRANGYSVRCIEDCSVVSDATEASEQNGLRNQSRNLLKTSTVR